MRIAKTLIRQGGCPDRLMLVFAGRTCHFAVVVFFFFHVAAHISKYFFSFFDAMYICISLNYAVIKQVLSSKK